MEINYPRVSKKVFDLNKIREALRVLFIIISLSCVLINVRVGGYPWSIIVVYAHWTSYRGLTGSLFENTLWIRLSQVVQNLCMLLFIINSIYGFDFAPTTISLIYLILFIVLLINSIFSIRNYAMNLLPITELFARIVMIFVGSLFGLISMNWALVALLIISATSIILGFIHFKDEVIIELKKRFH